MGPSSMAVATLTPQQLQLAAHIALYRKDYRRFAVEQQKVKPKFPIGSPARPFLFNSAQHQIERVVSEQIARYGWIRICILKYRQPGGSTYCESRLNHLTTLNPNVAALTIAQDEPTASHIFGITKLFYDCMDEAIKPRKRFSNKKELVFEEPDERIRARWPGLRSKHIIQTARNIHSGTGQTLHAIHLSECAKYEDAEMVWTSLTPSVPLASGTMIFLESTAHTQGEWFHEFCDASEAGENGYAFLFLPWKLQEEYRLALEDGEQIKPNLDERRLIKDHGLTIEQIKWRRYKIQELGGDELAHHLFTQEFPLTPSEAWISFDQSAFDQRKLYQMRAMVKPPLRITKLYPGPTVADDLHGELSIWEEPKVGEFYDIGADVAAGLDGRDWSVACVVKRSTKEQVAEWRRHIGPVDYGEELYWLGRYYLTAQIAVEVTGIGFSTNEVLQKMGYPNLYIWRYRGKAAPELSKWSGWETQPKIKRYMVSHASHMIQHDKALVRSQILLNELQTYVILGEDGFGSASRCNDDCVIAWMIALIISDDESFGAMAHHESLRSDRERRFVPAYLMDDFDEGANRENAGMALATSMKGWRE